VAAERLTVLLDWFVNPDHAPLIVAQRTRLLRRGGLEVEMVAPAIPNDPPKLVAAGQADIAVSISRSCICRWRPACRWCASAPWWRRRSTPWWSWRTARSASVADLKGRKVGYSVGGFEEACSAPCWSATG
jgi:putative hydroxymethylpyrimidine transport system substrate-binding protein